MSATPRPPDGYKGKPDERTRGERLRASKAQSEKVYLEPPGDLGPFEHLIGYLFEVGPTTGDQPVTWTEIDRWSQLVGVELDEFRAGAIRMLSCEFQAAYSRSRELITLAELLGDNEDDGRKGRA